MTETVSSYSTPRASGGYGEYMVYSDGSGDHSLTPIALFYSVFVQARQRTQKAGSDACYLVATHFRAAIAN